MSAKSRIFLKFSVNDSLGKFGFFSFYYVLSSFCSQFKNELGESLLLFISVLKFGLEFSETKVLNEINCLSGWERIFFLLYNNLVSDTAKGMD